MKLRGKAWRIGCIACAVLFVAACGGPLIYREADLSGWDVNVVRHTRRMTDLAFDNPLERVLILRVVITEIRQVESNTGEECGDVWPMDRHFEATVETVTFFGLRHATLVVGCYGADFRRHLFDI